MSKGWLAPFLLAVAACAEPSATRTTPLDRFAGPSAVALTAGGQALVVASGNYDLSYDGVDGGTVISVDPVASARYGGGALAPLGEGAHVGSFTGELVAVDADTCPTSDPANQLPEVLVATRFADQVWRLPLGAGGTLAPCTGAACVLPIDANLHDPFALTLACSATRRSAFVSYLRTASVGGSALVGWIAQVDLDHPGDTRVLRAGNDPTSGMAYDATTDRLYVMGRTSLAANVFVMDLTPCPTGLAACATPVVTGADLSLTLEGLDLQSIALSNPQAGLGRRAYVSARLYDPALGKLLGVRPGADIGAALLVLDVEENRAGHPALTILDVIPVGMGASQVKVLPVRPGLRDVVVVSSAVEGVLTVYDDDTGLTRTIPIDQRTGAPEAGRGPFGLAVALQPGGTTARVYVAASQQGVVGIVDVPLATPGLAAAPRDAAGALLRIGGLQ